jgi:hypothetical protein
MMAFLFLGNIDFSSWETWLAVGVGLGIALLAVVVGRILLAEPRAPVPRPLRPPLVKEAAARPDPFIQGSAGERRATLRRGGNPVAVLITDAEAKERPRYGWVLDRSMGGLGLSVDEPCAEGTILSVRAANAPPNIAWVQVEVRSCRPEGASWDLGCRFLRTPSWGVLLLFG